jgi:hypothetical protein
MSDDLSEIKAAVLGEREARARLSERVVTVAENILGHTCAALTNPSRGLLVLALGLPLVLAVVVGAVTFSDLADALSVWWGSGAPLPVPVTP